FFFISPSTPHLSTLLLHDALPISSSNFPTTPGTFQSTLRASQGNFNAFVSKLNSSATQLLYSTYLGGSVADQALGIAVDQAGNVDRKSTRLNSSHDQISYAVFCLK